MRRGGQLLANLRCEVIVRIGLQPRRIAWPFRRFITIQPGRPAPSPPRHSPVRQSGRPAPVASGSHRVTAAPQATASSAVAGRLRHHGSPISNMPPGKACFSSSIVPATRRRSTWPPTQAGNIARLAGDISAGILGAQRLPGRLPRALCSAAACWTEQQAHARRRCRDDLMNARLATEHFAGSRCRGREWWCPAPFAAPVPAAYLSGAKG